MFKNCIFLFITLLVSFAHGDVVKKLNGVISKYGVLKKELGIYVKQSKGKREKVLYQLNEKRLMTPASLSKIPTAGVALSELGLEFQYKTQIFIDGIVKNGELKGDLYLKGSGDPSFISEKMWYLVNEFRRTGVRKVKGQIIVDDSVFDRIRFEKNRDPDRGDRAYDAPNGGMSFNWNSVNIFIRPNQVLGKSAIIYLDPQNKWIGLKNRLTTVKKIKSQSKSQSKLQLKSNKIKVERKIIGKKILIEVSGHILKGDKEKVIYKNIPLPSLWAGHVLKNFLEQRGISVKGTVRLGKVPSTGIVVAASKSKPIMQIAGDMMKYSNNYIAEMLTKTLSINRTPPPIVSGTMIKGMRLIEDFLKNKIGLNENEYTMVSPSGLSRKNKFTPKALYKIMNYFRKSPIVSPEFMSSFPIAGVDGTLKERLKGVLNSGRVRAKTGGLSGVVGLAGFVSTQKEGIRLFVFMYNGKSSETKIKNMFDEMAMTLVGAL